MGWLSEFVSKLLPVHVEVQEQSVRRELVLRNKIDIFELEACRPVGLLRERRFRRTERLDFYHLQVDGSILHMPG